MHQPDPHPGNVTSEQRADQRGLSEPSSEPSELSELSEEMTAALSVLAAPVPPMLEAAIGYDGGARYVAFFWGAGDEAYYADGRVSATGEWAPYLEFLRHPLVRPSVDGHEFGASDAEAREYLLLDRFTRRLYAGSVAAVRAVLRQQWPEPTAAEREAAAKIDPEAVVRLLRARMNQLLMAESQLTVEQRQARIAAMVARARHHHQALRAWLEALPDESQAAAIEAEWRRSCQDATRNGA